MTEKTNKTWHILGAGAIGCLWACHIHGDGRQVHLLLSPRNATPANGKVKLYLQPPRGARKNVAVNASTATELVSPINNLIVSTKATQVLDALHSVDHCIAPGARIILLLNGMGFQHAVIEKFSNCKVFAGVTTDGAWLKRPFAVVQAGKGMTTLGALSTTASTEDAVALLHDLQNP
ncbi:MAG: 2-dehydropantoate 2-reductase, partial [Pseudomonadales bacterium]